MKYSPWILTIPVISTALITQEVAEDLSRNKSLFCARLPGAGWFVYIEDVNSNDPQCLIDIFEWARARDYDWVRLDADGDGIEGLPTYDW